MAPFEFAGANSGLIGAESFDCLFALVLGKETGSADVIVELPVDNRGCHYGDQTDKQENAVAEIR